MAAHPTIDVHAHFLPPAYREALQEAGLKTLDGGMAVPDWSPEGALAIMDEVGIAGGLLSISSPHVAFAGPERAVTLCRAINDYAADLKARRPDRFGGFAVLPLQDTTAALKEVERALGDLGLDGVALPTHVDGAYLGDARHAPLLEVLNARGTTVFVHPTSPQCFEAFGLGVPAPMIEFPFDTTRTVVSLIYSGALAKYPNIRFILPHAGGTLAFLAPRIARVGAGPHMGARAVAPGEVGAALKRFFYDTALSTQPQQMAALLALAPLSQVLYGSDFPFAPAATLRGAEQDLAALGLTEAQDEMIRNGNARRLFPAFVEHSCNCAAHHRLGASPPG